MIESKIRCLECNDADGGCQDCCPHHDIDHGVCLDCEKDLTEDQSAAAYDHAKDLKKYGGT